MPGERWEDIPEFSDYYQVSNYGRIKTLERWVERPTKGILHVKEKIRRATVQRALNVYTGKYSLYLTISLKTTARKTTWVVSRLVYYCFIKKFDLTNPKLIVTSKNGNNLDLHYKNLQLVPKGEVQLKAYREQTKRKPQFPCNMKRIAQYTTEGKLVQQFDSILQAMNITGFDRIGIRNCGKGRRKTYKGFIWKYAGK